MLIYMTTVLYVGGDWGAHVWKHNGNWEALSIILHIIAQYASWCPICIVASWLINWLKQVLNQRLILDVLNIFYPILTHSLCVVYLVLSTNHTGKLMLFKQFIATILAKFIGL